MNAVAVVMVPACRCSWARVYFCHHTTCPALQLILHALLCYRVCVRVRVASACDDARQEQLRRKAEQERADKERDARVIAESLWRDSAALAAQQASAEAARHAREAHAAEVMAQVEAKRRAEEEASAMNAMMAM